MRTNAVSLHKLKLPEYGPHSVLAATALVFHSPNQLTRHLLAQIIAAKPLIQPSEKARTSESSDEDAHTAGIGRGRRVTEIGVFVCCLAKGDTSLNNLI